MPDNSFDIVSKIELPEVSNAIAQALKEVITRYDLKDSKSTIELKEKDEEESRFPYQMQTQPSRSYALLVPLFHSTRTNTEVLASLVVNQCANNHASRESRDAEFAMLLRMLNSMYNYSSPTVLTTTAVTV
jgi:hypothetical protein